MQKAPASRDSCLKKDVGVPVVLRGLCGCDRAERSFAGRTQCGCSERIQMVPLEALHRQLGPAAGSCRHPPPDEVVLDVSHLATGTYALHLSDAHGWLAGEKFVVEQDLANYLPRLPFQLTEKRSRH